MADQQGLTIDISGDWVIKDSLNPTIYLHIFTTSPKAFQGTASTVSPDQHENTIQFGDISENNGTGAEWQFPDIKIHISILWANGAKREFYGTLYQDGHFVGNGFYEDSHGRTYTTWASDKVFHLQ